jgi:exodeoxyribonuclease VII large subunit
VRRAARTRERLTALERGLGDPRRRVQDLALRIDDLAARARRALVQRVAWDRRELAGAMRGLEAHGPAARVRRAREQLRAQGFRLERGVVAACERARATVGAASGKLDALSPLACLARGYALVRREDAEGPIVRAAAALAPGDPVALVFASGRARARVEETEP